MVYNVAGINAVAYMQGSRIVVLGQFIAKNIIHIKMLRLEITSNHQSCANNNNNNNNHNQ
jgi:hypothetical protein